MDYKNKAKELIEKFKPNMYCFSGSGMLSNNYDEQVAINNAKTCAILSIDKQIDLINEIDTESDYGLTFGNYLDNKIHELLKLKHAVEKHGVENQDDGVKLVSVKDYCIDDILSNSSFNHTNTRKLINYIKFLDKPLDKTMFVHMDLDGVELVKPDPKTSVEGGYSFDLERWNDAEKRILFKGFTSVDTRCETRVQFVLDNKYRKNNIDTIETDEYGFFFYNSRMEKSRLRTIGDLINFQELTLADGVKEKFRF